MKRTTANNGMEVKTNKQTDRQTDKQTQNCRPFIMFRCVRAVVEKQKQKKMERHVRLMLDYTGFTSNLAEANETFVTQICRQSRRFRWSQQRSIEKDRKEGKNTQSNSTYSGGSNEMAVGIEYEKKSIIIIRYVYRVCHVCTSEWMLPQNMYVHTNLQTANAHTSTAAAAMVIHFHFTSSSFNQ